METGDTNYIYKNEFDKTCFQHDAAYSESQDLTKRTQSDKVLKNKMMKLQTYDEYQRGLASIVFKFFHKKSVSFTIMFLENG